MKADAALAQRAMANRVVTLLALAIFINALDRGNFSTAAPLIKGEDYPPFRNGLPRYVTLKNAAVPKKLAKFEI